MPWPDRARLTKIIQSISYFTRTRSFLVTKNAELTETVMGKVTFTFKVMVKLEVKKTVQVPVKVMMTKLRAIYENSSL